MIGAEVIINLISAKAWGMALQQRGLKKPRKFNGKEEDDGEDNKDDEG